jgi:hypothetical protein
LRCRGSKQPPSSSTLSSYDTSSLLGYLHHRLSLLQHYSQWTSESGTTEVPVYLSLAAGASNFSVLELHSYSDRVHSTSSAQTSPSLGHSFHRLECLLQRADWSADSLAHHSCDFFRDVSFRDCRSSYVRGRDYRECVIVSCFNISSHSWYFSGSGDRDCSYYCYFIFSSCTCSTGLLLIYSAEKHLTSARECKSPSEGSDLRIKA